MFPRTVQVTAVWALGCHLIRFVFLVQRLAVGLSEAICVFGLGPHCDCGAAFLVLIIPQLLTGLFCLLRILLESASDHGDVLLSIYLEESVHIGISDCLLINRRICSCTEDRLLSNTRMCY
ncbi:hypothetical protein L1987_11884 [Smallanthus sonchifolius]|uniref:Uncharacterized protein n=1 Tax=Smallanthus sonchifolius TaxID=185202 RepID=A0ACB9JED1_9ASTR|nr:hypothetical protein L1987_11884 [Smallanthus sonchifolius]